MKIKSMLPSLAFCAALWALPTSGACWGERGHHAAARDAALAILTGVDLSAQSPADAALYRGLRDFCRGRAIELGHIANIPDTAWRSMGDEIENMNGPTHFMNSEILTDDFDTIPLDYQDALARYQGKPSRLDGRPVDLFKTGTLIWRAQQFYDRLLRDLKDAKAAETSRDFAAEKSAVFRALVDAGLMAHFIGDATMPYHNAADHDGYGTGNGGVHAFFESEVPNTETPRFELDVYDKIPAEYKAFGMDAKFSAGKNKPAAFITRALAKEALGRIPEVIKIDDALILSRSTVTAQGRNVPAKRKPADDADAAFRPIITEQVALAAAALSRLWRGAWEEAGRPDLAKARLHDYAHKPDFVEPSYDPDGVKRAKEEAALKKIRDGSRRR